MIKNQNSVQSTKRFFLLAATSLTIGTCACTNNTSIHGPDLASALNTGLNRQVIRSDAPMNRTSIDGLPGALSTQIYEKRYIKTMITEQTDDEETASQEFR